MYQKGMFSITFQHRDPGRGPPSLQASSAQSSPQHRTPQASCRGLSGKPRGGTGRAPSRDARSGLSSSAPDTCSCRAGREADGLCPGHQHVPGTRGGPGGPRKSWLAVLHARGQQCGPHCHLCLSLGHLPNALRRGRTLTPPRDKEPSKRPQRRRLQTQQEHAGLQGHAPHFLSQIRPPGLQRPANLQPRPMTRGAGQGGQTTEQSLGPVRTLTF